MIKIFNADERVFTNNGEKILHSTKAVVLKEDNGDYELELEIRDNFNISIMRKIGQDNGVTLRYGKNIQDITVKEDWSKVVTNNGGYNYMSSIL